MFFTLPSWIVIVYSFVVTCLSYVLAEFCDINGIYFAPSVGMGLAPFVIKSRKWAARKRKFTSKCWLVKEEKEG